MEKDLKLGSVGDLDLSFAGGKASLKLSAALPQASASGGAFLECDSLALIDKLFAAIEKASPAGAQAIEEGVKAIIKEAVAKLA